MANVTPKPVVAPSGARKSMAPADLTAEVAKITGMTAKFTPNDFNGPISETVEPHLGLSGAVIATTAAIAPTANVKDKTAIIRRYEGAVPHPDASLIGRP